MNTEKYNESKFKGRIEGLYRFANSIRTSSEDKQDISLAEVVEEKFQVSLNELLEDLGIDPMVDTISNLMNVNDMDVRWLIPEIIRDAIRLGLRDAPIWPNITASETEISQKSITMPYINMSDAAPRKVGEGETIPLGEISYGEKSLSVFKIGRGIKITYEIKQYVSLDLLSIFFQDFGIKLGQSLDTLAIDTLVNGDQADGSQAASVIGVATPGTKVYKDLLRLWVRASRMGRRFNTIIGGENAAIETLDLDEFKKRTAGTTDANLSLKTPVPRDANYFIHGNIPANQELLLDERYALAKFNVQPLLIESEKIVSNQTEAFYASLTVGFGKIFKDASLLMDKTVDFDTDGFPSYMDVDAYQNVVIE